MKRSLVSLAALAVAQDIARQRAIMDLARPMSPSDLMSTELSLEGMRDRGYPDEAIQAAGRRQIEQAVRESIDPRVVFVPAHGIGKTAALGLRAREDLGYSLAALWPKRRP